MATTGARPPIFLDTNTLIRATVPTAPQHQEVSAALQTLWNRDAEIWLSRQILREDAAVMSRPQTYANPATAAVIVAELRSFSTRFHIADENAQVTEKLMELMLAIPVGGKQIHDANIAATMLTYGITHLLTLNTVDFTRFSPQITVLSPTDI